MKDWIGNSNSIFKQLGASSHSSEGREENDFYATDPKAIDELFKREEFSKEIWECASGYNHLTDRMKEYGKEVFSSDIINRGCQDEIIDFLSPSNKRTGDFDIITNPPYKFCSEFILKALELIKEGHKIAMFLKLTTLEGQDRYKQIYSKYPPERIYVFSKRIQCGKNGEFKGTSAVCYAWFIWKKNYKGKTIIEWIY